MKKVKGFTLIEIVISVAISAIVLTVITTFFITNANSLALTDIKSTLQQEGENIKEAMVKSGTQSNGITNLWVAVGSNNTSLMASTALNYSELTSESATENPNSVEIKQIDFTEYTDYTNPNLTRIISFKLVNKELSIISINGTKVLSKNVKSFRIKPSDAAKYPTTATVIGQRRQDIAFNKTTGIEVVIELYKKKGNNQVTYPISMNIVFRNMHVTFG